ncbi:methyltransferase, TIGR04325 family [Aetokthonos hydrillicola Thurmond2011]|jgi:putative methyltransferase (TIGR04325 family)|uniref:Methyltransferase, TIGR04325 family n=1 Tax=Aetokthonos hydrillicola Thurmond2011 TaxID=2712845 RepID=A0AAP5I6W7_9CYAN|nr:methyltransferase, TIGR04325 family [Aetokthonos hydrillicola]MBO3464071.1 methyltransferase, TIGR04325 family [Aetokthonos hydrillicola CCALA 1050]MBW4590068.1 methyltransferase, TIGR04325 family [Aetokthonos hydrillicola CCALA 1050]MDR9894879.1 methyltransferase, TIGR04325 family [Aetokthonos hydrillicola Thurmond2011]
MVKKTENITQSLKDYQEQIENKNVINKLIYSRKEIAEYWLNLSTDNLEKSYLGNIGRAYKFLLNSNIKNESLTEEETIFLNEILENQRESSVLPEWEYLPEGWGTKNFSIKGWDVESILKIRKQNLPELLQLVQSTRPLGKSYSAHNTYMTYAYVLALTARKKDKISILDWGGGIGDYYLISKSLMPDIEIDYHCKEVPFLCEGGRECLPEVHFYEDEEECFKQSYDLVLASSSLQYVENWQIVAQKLAAVSRSSLYITRLPIVHQAESFVVLQRAYRYGYQTEYMGWFLNRQVFLNYLSSLQMELVREFLIEERFSVQDAPEHAECRGFLFCPQVYGSKT